MRSIGWTAAVLVACMTLASSEAQAEEGLFVGHLRAGAASVDAGHDPYGLLWAASGHLWIGEGSGVATDASYEGHPAGGNLRLSAGLALLAVEARWTRLALSLGPQLAFGFPHRSETTVDLAAQASVGVEHILMWGFGLGLDLRVAYPLARLTPGEPVRRLAGAATAGIFVEF